VDSTSERSSADLGMRLDPDRGSGSILPEMPLVVAMLASRVSGPVLSRNGRNAGPSVEG
jgi:hypothetical protein